jgi:hypothetical protein
MHSNFDTVTVGLLAFLVGATVSPYLSLAFEWWMSRPRRITPHDPFDHCGPECQIR